MQLSLTLDMYILCIHQSFLSQLHLVRTTTWHLRIFCDYRCWPGTYYWISLIWYITLSFHVVFFLFHSCTWQGKPCNISEDFVTTLTDLGVCYTFNSGLKKAQITVTESGTIISVTLYFHLFYRTVPKTEALKECSTWDQPTQNTPEVVGYKYFWG